MVRLQAPMKQFLEQAKLEPEKPGNALLAEGEAREALQKVLVDDDAEEQPHLQHSIGWHSGTRDDPRA